MKLTDKQRGELKALATEMSTGPIQATLAAGTLDLLDDFEEYRSMHHKLVRRLIDGNAELFVQAMAEKDAEIATVRKQLAEAQAMNSAAAEILAAGIREEQLDHESLPEPVSQWDYEAGQMVFALRNQNTAALQSAIEQAVAPYKWDADRYRWLCDVATENQWIEFGGYTVKRFIDASIDAAMSAKEKSNG